MHLKALKHLAAVAAAIAQKGRIVVFGSSSILGTYPEADSDYELVRRSRDADFVIDPYDDGTARIAHDALGVDSVFDQQYGCIMLTSSAPWPAKTSLRDGRTVWWRWKVVAECSAWSRMIWPSLNVSRPGRRIMTCW